MEMHANGTCVEINGGRQLISAISRMTDQQRAALPEDVLTAYTALWNQWLERRERDMPQITDRSQYWT